MAVQVIPDTSGAPGAAIQLRQVVKKFETAAGKVTVLKGIDLTLNSGEFAAIVGKSGSGKSTLLNMITGIDHPTSGEVVVAGTHIYEMNESRRALWRGRNLGIVFQFFQLLPMLTLLENTMLPMDYCKSFAPAARPQRAMDLLKLVGLDQQADKLPAAVSTGQQQCAAIARGLATDPPIIVADEPTGNLDSRSAEIIINLFDQLARQGKTIAMVTHDPSLTERTTRQVIISDGEIVDHTIARALPLLNHRQMLAFTHLVERKVYQPGEPILQRGQEVAYFYMIAAGQVEVDLQNPKCPDLSIGCLGPGDHFGEVELVYGGKAAAGVAAAAGAQVELLLLPREAFIKQMQTSPPTQDALAKIANARLEENRLRDRRCR
jgi:putative ABC transport system ATP-binding protein